MYQPSTRDVWVNPHNMAYVGVMLDCVLTLTTLRVLGFVEINPFMVWLMELYGVELALGIKAMVSMMVITYIVKWPDWSRWLVCGVVWFAPVVIVVGIVGISLT